MAENVRQVRITDGSTKERLHVAFIMDGKKIEPLRRIGIYSFYDKDGIVGAGDLAYLRAMRNLLDQLIIVANGTLEEQSKQILGKLANRLEIRENKGYDAGGYQHVLLPMFETGELDQYDELILFNNTVFGPLYPLEDCFSHMEAQDVDFWGMTRDHPPDFPEHIQSYFMAFRKPVFESRVFTDFWKHFSTDFSIGSVYVIVRWEEIFTELLHKHGFTYASVVKEVGPLLFDDPLRAISLGAPVIKKRLFRDDPGKAMCMAVWETMKEEIRKRNPAINTYILEYMKRTNCKIRQSPVEKKAIQELKLTNQDILQGIECYSKVYFYGIIGRSIYLLDQVSKEKYFIESDSRYHGDHQGDFTVLKLSEVPVEGDDAICVNFLRPKNTKTIINELNRKFKHVLHVFPQDEQKQ